MNKGNIQSAINGIPASQLISMVLYGARGYSREDAVTNQMTINLGPNYQSQYTIQGKRVDIVGKMDVK